jgi:fatty acid desaturase
MAFLTAQVYLVPYAIVNMWLVMITFLQHCHPSLPNYDDKEVCYPATQHTCASLLARAVSVLLLAYFLRYACRLCRLARNAALYLKKVASV